VGDVTLINQTAYLAPKGLFGLLYWYILYPIHGLIFSGLIRKLKILAESDSPHSTVEIEDFGRAAWGQD
jgi:hypothetical protein